MLTARTLVQSILRKIIKIVATRCHNNIIFRLKCTKFDFGWGSTPEPRPRWGSLQRSTDLLAGFQGA